MTVRCDLLLSKRHPLADFYRRTIAMLLAAALLIGSLSRPAQAQQTDDDKKDDEPPPPPAPLLVIHVSALERVLQRLKDNMHDIDRDDVGDAFSSFIEGNAGGIKGLDRSRPFGVALFLTQGLPPTPVPVVYAPISDFDDLIKTMELGSITVKRLTAAEAGVPEDSGEERYTMTIPGGGQREIVVRDGYVFLSRNETFLEGDVASLAKLAPRLSAQYDAAVSIDLTTISPLIRDVFLGMLRNQAQAELQRRDDEPMSQYIVRKANGLSTLELIEHVLRDGRNVTLGVKMREDSTNTILELNAEATPDSEFAQYLADLAGHPSSYASLVNDREPMTLSASWMMAPREQRVGREWISSLAHSMTDALTPKVEPGTAEATDPAPVPKPPTAAEFVPHPAVQAVLDSLNATVDAGHFDVCFQFRELEPGRFGMIGAMRVVGGETLAGGLRELLTALQTQKAAFDISQDVAEHAGVAFHRVRSHEQRAEDRRVYGDDSGLYVGASAQTLWFAVGSSRVLTELKSAIDRVAAAATEPPSRQAPIQFLMQANPWLALSPEEVGEEDDGDDAARRHEMSEEAFDSDNDGMKLEIRPTENGARLRVELEAGFARMLTLMIAERYDLSRL